jgi:CRP/FNR family cyclic AMP-dependent transcriptional regulator
MMDMEAAVREHAFLSGLDDAVIISIAGCGKNVVFQPDEYIFREGDQAQQFYLVKTGLVALEIHMPGRGEISFLTVKGNDILGYSSLVEPYRCLYDARAVEPVRAIALDHQCLVDKCEGNHQMGYEVLKRVMTALTQRLHAARLQSANLYAGVSN